MRNKALTFMHGAVYASLILISCFAYGMYTTQLRVHQETQQLAAYSDEDYLSTIAKSKGR